MKNITCLMICSFFFFQNFGQQINNSYGQTYIYNLIIDCKSNLYENDFKIIVCNNHEKINRINLHNKFNDRTLYYISYNYDNSLNRIPCDTTNYLLNNSQLDSIFFLMEKIFLINIDDLTYEKKNFEIPSMYDGLNTEIFLDIYYYNELIIKKFNYKNDELENAFKYFSGILKLKIDYY